MSRIFRKQQDAAPYVNASPILKGMLKLYVSQLPTQEYCLPDSELTHRELFVECLSRLLPGDEVCSAVALDDSGYLAVSSNKTRHFQLSMEPVLLVNNTRYLPVTMKTLLLVKDGVEEWLYPLASPPVRCYFVGSEARLLQVDAEESYPVSRMGMNSSRRLRNGSKAEDAWDIMQVGEEVVLDSVIQEAKFRIPFKKCVEELGPPQLGKSLVHTGMVFYLNKLLRRLYSCNLLLMILSKRAESLNGHEIPALLQQCLVWELYQAAVPAGKPDTTIPAVVEEDQRLLKELQTVCDAIGRCEFVQAVVLGGRKEQLAEQDVALLVTSLFPDLAAAWGRRSSKMPSTVARLVCDVVNGLKEFRFLYNAMEHSDIPLAFQTGSNLKPGEGFRLINDGDDDEHGEARLLAHFLKTDARIGASLFVGVSKPCCPSCAHLLSRFGVKVKAHGARIFDNWVVPSFFRTGSARETWLGPKLHKMLEKYGDDAIAVNDQPTRTIGDVFFELVRFPQWATNLAL